MSSVIVSTRSFTSGADVAAALAQRLGLQLANVDTLAASAAATFPVAADKVVASLLHPPSLLGMGDRTRRRIATLFVAEATTLLGQDGNAVVLHVPFGAFLAPGISHVLRARLTARPEKRAALAQSTLHVSSARAARRVADDDRDGDTIATLLFGRSDEDGAYDEVLDVSALSVDQAADALARCARDRRYMASSYSARCAQELAAQHRILAALSTSGVDATVQVREGRATIRVHAAPGERGKLTAAVEDLVRRLPSVSQVEWQWVDDLFDTYAASMR